MTCCNLTNKRAILNPQRTIFKYGKARFGDLVLELQKCQGFRDVTMQRTKGREQDVVKEFFRWSSYCCWDYRGMMGVFQDAYRSIAPLWRFNKCGKPTLKAGQRTTSIMQQNRAAKDESLTWCYFVIRSDNYISCRPQCIEMPNIMERQL